MTLELNSSIKFTKVLLLLRCYRDISIILLQADVFAKLRHAIWQALEEHKTRVEMQQVDAVEAERQRQAQMRAARERVKQKRIRSQYIKERKCTDGWEG